MIYETRPYAAKPGMVAQYEARFAELSGARDKPPRYLPAPLTG